MRRNAGRSERLLNGLRDWITRNNNTVIPVLCFADVVKLIAELMG